MPTSRYDERKILRNKTFQYANSAIFQKRRVEVIEQYNTPELVYPNAEDLEDISIITRNWGVGVKYFNYNVQWVWWSILASSILTAILSLFWMYRIIDQHENNSIKATTS